jgi:hypothetical protein
VASQVLNSPRLVAIPRLTPKGDRPGDDTEISRGAKDDLTWVLLKRADVKHVARPAFDRSCGYRASSLW